MLLDPGKFPEGTCACWWDLDFWRLRTVISLWLTVRSDLLFPVCGQ